MLKSTIQFVNTFKKTKKNWYMIYRWEAAACFYIL